MQAVHKQNERADDESWEQAAHLANLMAIDPRELPFSSGDVPPATISGLTTRLEETNRPNPAMGRKGPANVRSRYAGKYRSCSIRCFESLAKTRAHQREAVLTILPLRNTAITTSEQFAVGFLGMELLRARYVVPRLGHSACTSKIEGEAIGNPTCRPFAKCVRISCFTLLPSALIPAGDPIPARASASWMQRSASVSKNGESIGNPTLSPSALHTGTAATAELLTRASKSAFTRALQSALRRGVLRTRTAPR